MDRALQAGDTVHAARSLLGARLVRETAGTPTRVGRIVEVEAYLGPQDRASHARFGRTPRTSIMFGPPGRAYVYRVYGMHSCLNVVTEPDGVAAAVLIRAVAPLEGEAAFREARLSHELMRRRATRRTTDTGAVAQPGATAEAATREAAGTAAASRIGALPIARLASGPGLVGAAFSIDTDATGTDLCDAACPLRLESAPAGDPLPTIRATARIGVDYAIEGWAERELRFFVAGDPSVSGPGSRR